MINTNMFYFIIFANDFIILEINLNESDNHSNSDRENRNLDKNVMRLLAKVSSNGL